jgi:hypothetical protein
MALERLARLKNERKAIAETPPAAIAVALNNARLPPTCGRIRPIIAARMDAESVVSLRKGAIGSRHDYRLTHRHAAVKTRIAMPKLPQHTYEEIHDLVMETETSGQNRAAADGAAGYCVRNAS